MSKYRKVLDESLNVTRTNKWFRRFQQRVATFEQTRKRLFCFNRKILEEHAIYTKLLQL